MGDCERFLDEGRALGEGIRRGGGQVVFVQVSCACKGRGMHELITEDSVDG